MRGVFLMVLLGAAMARAEARWPGEQRRLHLGVGARSLAGAMFQRGATFLVLEGQLFAVGALRLGDHHELRVQLGLSGGWPYSFEGETNVGVRVALSPRVALGVSGFVAWGLPSLRGGLEVPLSVRFGARRSHEVTLSVRGSAGAFNNITFAWWDLAHQAFAWSVEGSLGYTYFF